MSRERAYTILRAGCIGLALIAALAMSLVTLVAERTDSTPAEWVAMPGLICHMMIASGHGGTHSEEVVGFTIAVIVNAFVGVIPSLIAILIFKRLRTETWAGSSDT